MPAYKAGGPIQSIANLVNNFKENINYKIFCSNTDVDGLPLNVRCNEWINYNDHTQVWYASKEKRLLSTIKHEIEFHKPQVLFINGIYSLYFNLVPLLLCNAPRKIISVRGMLHPGALTQKSFKKKCYFFLLKLTGIHRRCEFHACDTEEKIYIQEGFGNASKIYVAQNFPKALHLQQPLDKNKNSLCLVSVALITPMKNILPVLLALKTLDAKIVYHIYGPVKDEQYWKKCLQQIEDLPPNIQVKYYGAVEQCKVEAALSQSHIFILPSKSENFGHAILEALSAGKPVITSNNTPWKNLENSKAGINTEAEIISLKNAINLFSLMDHAEYSVWSMGAARYAANAVNFKEVENQYKKMFHIEND